MSGEAAAWITAIAARADADEDHVQGILDGLGIKPFVMPPLPRRLTIESVHFTGHKIVNGRTSAVDFSWGGLGSGTWCVASHENLVGKSTVLRVILWALRGSPPGGLQADVRRWIETLEIVFAIDGERFQVALALVPELRGALRRRAGSGWQDLRSFSGAADFGAVMEAFMIERLGLDPIPSRLKYSGSEDSRTVFHSWPAYASSLYLGGHHEHLLGDTPFGGLPGRLLQMFVGTPWASTLFAVRAAKAQMDQDERNDRRRTDEDRRYRKADLEPLRQQLAEAHERLAATADAGALADRLAADYATVVRLTADAAALKAEHAEAGEASKTAKRLLTDRRRKVAHIEDAQAAQSFFQGLDPSLCPRCRKPIGSDRRHREHDTHECFVCTEPLPPADEAAFEQDLKDAREARDAAAAALDAAQKHEAAVLERLCIVTAELADVQGRIEAAAAQDQTLERRRDAEIEVAKLEAVLHDRETLLNEHDGTSDGLAARVIAAALRETESRAKAGDGALMEQLNRHILKLGQRFGIVALEAVELDRTARLKVRKGGAVVTFSDLTAGERLRLRLATVIAMLRIGELEGVGRHPGFLMIDSPGGEEAKQQNVAALLAELDQLAGELPHLQIIVASAQAPLVARVLDPARVRVAEPGEALW